MCKDKATIIVVTGNGKGKTTTALGLAVQSALTGQKAVVAQFLKGGGYTGELFAADYLAPHFLIRQFGHGCPIASAIKDGTQKCNKCGLCFRENRNPANGYALQALAFAEQVVDEGEARLLVLDEISHALRHGLIPVTRVLALLFRLPADMTVVLTGRNMHEDIVNMADYVTLCEAVKHPMADSGIDARRGTEY